MPESVRMADNQMTDLRYCIYDILKPILKLMKIFGIYYDKGDDESSKSATWPTLGKFHKLYCVAVIVLVWINVLRYIPSFWVGFDYHPNQTVNRVIKQTWLFQCAITVSILLWHCRKGTWNCFYKNWYQMIMDESCSNYINKKTNQMRRICKLFLFVAILYFIFQVTFTLVSTLTFLSPVMLTNPFPATTGITILILMLELFDYAAWIFPNIFIMVICYSLAQAFVMVTRCLQNFVSNAQRFRENLNIVRQIHLKLCRMTEHLDNPFRLWIVNVIGCNIFLACFIIYLLVKTEETSIVGVILKFSWLITNILTVFIASWFIASVNQSAHSPLENIYDLQTHGLTTEQLGELTLFLSKLTGTSIGFTAMGFFTITKEVILTIGGLYLTYVFLLLQYNIN